jgi:hypothetical protein
LEEFQRISSKQELRAALREALKAACKAGEGSPVLGLFEQRALARPNQIKSPTPQGIEERCSRSASAV